MKKIGLVGWRGMVGSVLMQRMVTEGDFKKIIPYYFSTSSPGKKHIDVTGTEHILLDAKSVSALSQMDIIISCQGGDYTKLIYGDLRNSGWQGYWIDAASAKRMDADSVIVLDPVNRAQIDHSIAAGIKNFIGGNCSITLTLLGLAGLFRAGLIDWLSVMTYQAASGAGAAHVRELLSQMDYLSQNIQAELSQAAILPLMHKAHQVMQSADFPKTAFGIPLAGNIIPWIDSDLGNGTSREEWKGEVETNKILGLPAGTIAVDGLCVRVGALQCHSAAITMKLKKDMPLAELESLIAHAHEWVELVPNHKEATLHKLSPAALAGSLKIGVGRLKKLGVGEQLYSVLTVGDQLIWGAAEPLRRMLNILLD
jgi:aspartate-semialdehyde dehydrogenase